MIISKKHNFIYIGIYKTATTSIQKHLAGRINPIRKPKMGTRFVPNIDDPIVDKDLIGGVNETQEERHRDILAAKKLYLEDETEENWDKLYIFSFVRNPFDLVLSHFNYKRKVIRKMLEKFPDKKLTTEQELFLSLDFSDWVKEFGSINFMPNDHADQYSVLSDNDDKLLVDDIGRFENLHEHFNYFMTKVGLPQGTLPHNNSTEHEHYSSYYDDKSKAIIAKKFARDIDFFKYSF